MSQVLGPTRPIRHCVAALWFVVSHVLVAWPLGEAAAGDLSESVPRFRYHLFSEPSGIDPAQVTNSESAYLLLSLFDGLYRLNAEGRPEPRIAESCRWHSSPQSTQPALRCRIRASASFTDGTKIRSQDVIESWRRLFAKNSKGLGASLLYGVKNARAVHRGDLSVEALGLKSRSDRELEILFEAPPAADPEFLSRLTHPALSITKSTVRLDRAHAVGAATSGAYTVQAWIPGQRLRLAPRSSPASQSASKPGTAGSAPFVEVLFIDDDETALNLYRSGELSFLRRLPTSYIPRYKGRPDFHQIPVFRFDYIGFGPELKAHPEFRRALAHSLNYEELRVIYDALGRPGCPGLPLEWQTDVHCHAFDLTKAQAAWKKVPVELKERRWTLHFSKLGGDDIQKGMEWMQAQWKRHLNVKIDLQPVEQGVYLQQLRDKTPALFRKGVGPDRATCSAALEIFSPQDPENFIGYDNPKSERALATLKLTALEFMKDNPPSSRTRASQKARQLCSEGIQHLMNDYAIIPMGRIHFTILVQPEWTGWTLNPLNQLDLSRLRWSPSKIPSRPESTSKSAEAGNP